MKEIQLIALTATTMSSLIYITMILLNYGILPSISNSFYVMTNRDRWTFRLMILMICAGFILASNFNIIYIIAMSFLSLVAIFARYKSYEKVKGIMHKIGAICAMLIGYYAMIDTWILIIISVVLMIPFLLNKNRVFFIEIIAVLTNIVYLFIKILN